MRVVLVIFSIVILTVTSCRKEKHYEINLINETGVDIEHLTLEGTTDYEFTIPANGESGKTQIIWAGPMAHWNGYYTMFYRVDSYSIGGVVTTDTTGCFHGLVVKELDKKALNTLVIKRTTDNPCMIGGYDFYIEIKE